MIERGKNMFKKFFTCMLALTCLSALLVGCSDEEVQSVSVMVTAISVEINYVPYEDTRLVKKSSTTFSIERESDGKEIFSGYFITKDAYYDVESTYLHKELYEKADFVNPQKIFLSRYIIKGVDDRVEYMIPILGIDFCAVCVNRDSEDYEFLNNVISRLDFIV